MHTTIEDAGAAVFQSIIDSDDWDVLPEIGLVFVEEATGSVEINEFAFERAFFEKMPVPDVIAKIAEITSSPECPTIKCLPSHRFIGVALIHEGWGVAVKTDDVAELDQVRAAAREHILHQHPDRVEVHQLSVVTEDKRYGWTQNRGETDMMAVVSPHGDDEADGVSLGGRIFEVLETFRSALARKIEYVDRINRDDA